MKLTADALLIRRSLAGRLGRLDGPFKLTTAITWECGQRCTHCRIWRRERSQELSAAEWREVWKNVSNTLSWLDLTGGEVTDRNDFVEIALAALAECPNLAMLHFPSNGRNIDRLEEATRAIMAAGPNRLIVSLSLDGPPAVHDKLRGDKGAFDAVIESYKRLKSLGTEVYFGMTLSPWNIDQLDATCASVRTHIPSFEWRDLHVNFLHESPHFFGNTGIQQNDAKALEKVVEELVKKRGLVRSGTDLLERLYLKRVPEYLANKRSPLPCGSMAGHAFIDPAGMVYPCHIWDRPVASLLDNQFSLANIWKSEKAKRIREQVKKEQCPGCWTPCEAYPTILMNLPESVL
jgi:MoaA/NifB/PqqE/SkfB family radical SAM enzyme